MKQRLQALSLSVPRVFHIGQCGTHANKNEECSAESIVLNLEESFQSSFNNLFPSNLNFGSEFIPNFILRKNGGWGDERDHTLCLNMTT